MSNIQNIFNKGPAYVAYLTAGDGGIDKTYEYAMALIEGGVDILEIGVPFSDPVADGPTIQAAAQRALTSGTTIQDSLTLIRRIKSQSSIPIILFSYYNPIFIAEKKSKFYQQAKQAGTDGMLVVDLPMDESTEHLGKCHSEKLDSIFLISPSTSTERVQKMNQLGSGMLYYVCRPGTTGVKNSLPEDFSEKMLNIKSAITLPIVAGFGVSNQEMAGSILNYADGFVVGSYFVDAISKGVTPSELKKLAAAIDPR